MLLGVCVCVVQAILVQRFWEGTVSSAGSVGLAFLAFTLLLIAVLLFRRPVTDTGHLRQSCHGDAVRAAAGGPRAPAPGDGSPRTGVTHTNRASASALSSEKVVGPPSTETLQQRWDLVRSSAQNPSHTKVEKICSFWHRRRALRRCVVVARDLLLHATT